MQVLTGLPTDSNQLKQIVMIMITDLLQVLMILRHISMLDKTTFTPFMVEIPLTFKAELEAFRVCYSLQQLSLFIVSFEISIRK